jgi:hypothetical protein
MQVVILFIRCCVSCFTIYCLREGFYLHTSESKIRTNLGVELNTQPFLLSELFLVSNKSGTICS